MPNATQLIVVETNPYLQVILEAALGETAEVNHAHSSDLCLAAIESTSAMFVDLMLEDVDGLSLIEKIRMKDAQIPIIAFVAQTEISSMQIEEAATRSMAEQCGADAVFFAPFNLGEILHTTTRMLEPIAATA